MVKVNNKDTKTTPIANIYGEAFKVTVQLCVKSVQLWTFFWSVFSCIWTEYGDLHQYLIDAMKCGSQINSKLACLE